MRLTVRRFASLLAVTAFVVGGATVADAKGKSIAWQKDFKKAQSAAAKQSRMMMVDVYTDWCPPCKELDRSTWPNAKVVNLAGKMIAVKINPEKGKANEAIAQKYKIEGYPTILFLDGKGKVIHQFIGGCTPAEMVQQMETAMKKFKAGKSKG